MTGDRAGLAAQTFLLPQPQPRPVAPAEQPYNDGVQALEGLQYVKGQTADYYKKVADLKSFMQSVHQNLGIDVRVPDLSRPESIKLNQIYRDAIADISAQGNELKQGASINNMLISRGDVLTSTYGNQSAARAQYGQDFHSGKLDPSVVELNNKLQMPSYTEDEYKQKETARLRAIKYWEDIKATQPEKAEWAEFNLRGISPTTQGAWRPQADTSYDRKFGKQVAAAGNYLKKISNIYLGTDDSFQPNERKVDAVNGLPVLESKEFRGRKVGEYILEGWRFYPGEERTTVMLKDPKTGGISEQEITQEDAQTIAAGIGGLPIEAMAEYVDKNKLVDDYQFLDKRKAAGFTGEDDYTAKRQANIKKSEGVYNHGFSMAVTDLDTNLSSLKAASEKPFQFFSIREDDEITLGKFNIKKIGPSEWEITNIKDIIPVGGNSAAAYEALIKEKKKWTNLEDLKAFIMSKGYAKDYREKLQKEGVEPEQQTTGTNSAGTTTASNTGGAY